MKKHTKIALGVVVGGLALASASAVVVAKDRIDTHRGLIMASGGHHGMSGWGKSDRRAMMKERAVEMFKEHDANQDGAVTQAEVDQVRSHYLAKYDANKDGSVSLDEFESLWLDRMRARMVDGFQHLDADGSGAISSQEYIAPFANVISRHDMDNDGDVDEDELNRHMKRMGKRHHDHDDDDDDDHHRGRDRT